MSKRIKFQGNEYMSVNVGITVAIPINAFHYGTIIGSSDEIEEVG